MVANALGTVRDIRISYEGQEETRRASDYIDTANAVDVDQLWFWTEEWQALEAEADKDFAQGRYTSHADMDDFIASLDS